MGLDASWDEMLLEMRCFVGRDASWAEVLHGVR